MSTSSSFTGFFATSIIDIYPELYINEKDEYDDTEFQELMKEFYKKEICEEGVYNQIIRRNQLSEANSSKYEIVKNVIKENEIKIDKVYGLNGEI